MSYSFINIKLIATTKENILITAQATCTTSLLMLKLSCP